jgi:hypothetical protein
MQERGMTFNQWCAGKPLAPHERIRFEDVWNALVEHGCEPARAGKLLSELLDAVLKPDWQ